MLIETELSVPLAPGEDHPVEDEFVLWDIVGDISDFSDIDGDDFDDDDFDDDFDDDGVLNDVDLCARSPEDRDGFEDADGCPDIDNDGDQDLYVTAIHLGNVLFENDGHGRFKDVSQYSGLDYEGHSGGAVFFDFDRDGLLDLFLANVGRYTTERQVRVIGVRSPAANLRRTAGYRRFGWPSCVILRSAREPRPIVGGPRSR